jgi:hypothetical protein
MLLLAHFFPLPPCNTSLPFFFLPPFLDFDLPAMGYLLEIMGFYVLKNLR